MGWKIHIMSIKEHINASKRKFTGTGEKVAYKN